MWNGRALGKGRTCWSPSELGNKNHAGFRTTSAINSPRDSDQHLLWNFLVASQWETRPEVSNLGFTFFQMTVNHRLWHSRNSVMLRGRKRLEALWRRLRPRCRRMQKRQSCDSEQGPGQAGADGPGSSYYQGLEQEEGVNISDCTSFLQRESHVAARRRKVKRRFPLSVPTPPVCSEVQQEVHDVGTSTTSRSVKRSVLSTACLHICSWGKSSFSTSTPPSRIRFIRICLSIQNEFKPEFGTVFRR